MVDHFVTDWRSAGLDKATVALLEYTDKLTRTPQLCGENDVRALRKAGWDDRAIHDATQICAYFNYINRIAEGLGVEPEEWIDETGRVIKQ